MNLISDSTSSHSFVRTFLRNDGDDVRAKELGRHDVHRNTHGIHHRRRLRHDSQVSQIVLLIKFGLFKCQNETFF